MDTMNTEEIFNRFYNVIDDMIHLFDELTSFEEKKLNAVIGNDVLRLEHLMNEEQAYVLKMRGLDQKREKLQLEMGLGGKTFSQMIDAAPEEYREGMSSRKQILEGKHKELLSAVEKTKTSIQGHLQRLDQVMQQVKKDGHVYNKNGQKEGTPPAPTRFKPTKA